MKREDLERYKKKEFTIYDFMISKYGNEEFFTNCKKRLEESYLSFTMKNIRASEKDFLNVIRELPIKDALELGEILKREFGEDISLLEKKRIAHIQKIIKKGKIANLDEYELVQGRTDEIYADADKQEELSSLNNLLIKFDTQK